MRRIDAWLAGLPAIALCLCVTGCGGGSGGDDEVPVVDMRDPNFGGAPAPPPAPGPPAAAPAGPQGAPLPGAPGGFAPGPGSSGPGAASPLAGQPGAENPPVSPMAGGLTASPDGNLAGDAALNEMLAAVNSANDPSAERGRSGGPAQQGGPGQPGQTDPMMAMMGSQGGAMPGAPPMEMEGMMPGMAGPQGGFSGFEAGGPPGFPGGPGGFPGEQGGFPGAAGSTEPADFDSPRGAVDAFLNAIKAKDVQGLSDATALRAPREAETSSRRRTFQAIREMSLSEDELNTIADDFEGFEVAQMSRPTASGIVSFILRKQGDYGSTLQRRIDVRKERSGWKVNDVTGVSEIKRMGGRAMEQLRNRNQGNRP
ncbi:hypothetical protein AB1L88_00295 [Tautonia sp. JC769]|uniref:hypothetical protein n=1 Tax=Tautonia sp. JC769 TaxID=3232135 RepID=UPI00345893E1